MSLGRDYRRLWSASALSNLADGVFQVALPLLALRITRSPGEIAGLSLVARLPWLLFALPAGALADRLDRRRTMVRVDLARAVLIGALAAVTAAGHEQLWVLYLVAFGLGVGETLFDTAAQSVMPMMVGREQLSAANGRLYAAEMTMNQFVGPPLGGLIAGTAIALAFAGSAASYLAAALVLLTMTGRFRPVRAGGGVPPRLRSDIADGVRYLFRHRLLRTLALMTGVMNLMNSAAFAVFPLFAVKPGPLGLSDAGYGLFLTAMAVGALGGSLLAAPIERALGRARALFMAVVAGAVLIGGPALFTTVGPNATLLVVGGLGSVTWNVITVSLRQRIVPEPLMGRVNAGYRLLAWGTMPVGAALGGVLAEAFGVRTVFGVAALTQLTLIACFRTVTDEAIVDAEREPAPAGSVRS
ncbi:MAG TPA: MFS transporter [Acidimicrobiia bacterium]